jgi:ABC-type antimicrobial peptide transport system permease subunit
VLTAASVLVAIAVLVCAVPGRQAARVNPIEILRAE